jgi:hypothetical protein
MNWLLWKKDSADPLIVIDLLSCSERGSFFIAPPFKISYYSLSIGGVHEINNPVFSAVDPHDGFRQ